MNNNYLKIEKKIIEIFKEELEKQNKKMVDLTNKNNPKSTLHPPKVFRLFTPNPPRLAFIDFLQICHLLNLTPTQTLNKALNNTNTNTNTQITLLSNNTLNNVLNNTQINTTNTELDTLHSTLLAYARKKETQHTIQEQKIKLLELKIEKIIQLMQQQETQQGQGQEENTKLYSSVQAAKKLNVSTTTFHAKIKPHLENITINNRKYYTKQALENFINTNINQQ